MQSEGTVVFHVCHAARMGHSIVKDVIKVIRAGAQAPNLVLDQFIVFIALGLSSSKPHRQTIIDCLKATILRAFIISSRRQKEAWFRNAMDRVPDPFKLLRRLIRQAIQFGGWDVISGGVLDLAICLLDVSPGLKKPCFLGTTHFHYLLLV